MTKSEARAFKARWAKVNAAERKEVCTASLEQKARQTAALMASVQAFNWTGALASEEAEVRERWNELRKSGRK
ncbi:MAG: hypothetical protein AB1798_14775 [Spirochaetota bacterium]